MDETKEDSILTTRNPMHQEIDINSVKVGMKNTEPESNFKLTTDQQELLKTLASNLIVLLFIFVNGYVLLTSWL